MEEFDSDFNESESDDDRGVDVDDEGEEEKELHAEERRNAVAAKRKKNQRLGVPLLSAISSAGRELMKKKTGKVSRRGPLGEGWNEGIVLNWPPPLSSSSADGMVGVAVARERGRPLKSTTVTMTQSLSSTTAMSDVPAAITDQLQIPSQPVTHCEPLLPQHHISMGATSATSSAPNIIPPPKKLKRQLEQEKKIKRRFLVFPSRLFPPPLTPFPHTLYPPPFYRSASGQKRKWGEGEMEGEKVTLPVEEPRTAATL
jgi:hypothetical protein